jgi:Predicted membrane protein (DUF2306)
MNTATANRLPTMPRWPAASVLKAAGVAWLVVAVLGQLLFAAYVMGFYGRAALQGQFETWNKVLPRGFVAGETAGNTLVALHLLFTTIIIVAGALQLLPALRRHAPRVHRWNGRLYLLSALVLATGGLTMLLTRGTVGGFWQHVAISVNGVLILACGALVLWHARARRFDAHRRWALRLFLLVGGVWFFRIGLMLWLLIHRAPVGFDPKTFTGPFLVFLSFAQYVLPLLVLELYLAAQRSSKPALQLGMSGLMALLTLATVAGIAGAGMAMWLPRM